MLGLLLILALIGVLAWAITTYVPMPAGIRTLIIVVAIVCAVIYVLNAFGINLPNPGLPRVHGSS